LPNLPRHSPGWCDLQLLSKYQIAGAADEEVHHDHRQ
jgi:hypothetical protein